MTNAETSPYFSDLLNDLQVVAQTSTLFDSEIRDAIAGLKNPFTNTDDLIHAVQVSSRLVAIAKSGLLDNQEFKNDFDRYDISLWRDTPAIDAADDLQNSLGERLYNVQAEKESTAHVLMMIGDGAGKIVSSTIQKLIGRHVPFQFNIPNDSFARLLFLHISDEGLKTYAQYWIENNEPVTHRIIALPNTTPASPVPKAEGRGAEYKKLIEGVSRRGMSGEVMFTLTYFPSRIDEEIDGIPYEDYLNLYFEMCDQPDAYIEKANEFLISKLNETDIVRFTNKEGTDISMSLTDFDGKQFTFANSQTKKNIPGSEVFSAPRRNSLNGTIVSKGTFMPKTDKDKQIVNLTLNFVDGKLENFSAEQGEEHFAEFINHDPGNRYVGELGIGTNPHLKRHVANGLLVEKVSSSFHLALGAAYTMTDYLGAPVHMDNGNRSVDHWDITTMLGDMYLDGEIVMKDGKFIAPELDVLNRGWNAVPVEDRPDRWKNYKGPYTKSGTKN